MFHRSKIHASRIGSPLALAIVAALFATLGGCGVIKDLRELRDQVGSPLPFDTGGAVFVDVGDAEDELPPRLDTGVEPERDTERNWDADPGAETSPVPDVTFDEPPLISDVFPRYGPTRGGTFVSVLGARFDWGTRVYLGGIEVDRIDIIDEYELFFITPPLEAGPHDLKITASGGSAALENAFTAVESLSVTSVSPVSGLDSGGTPVAVTGTGFDATTRFVFGRREATDVRVIGATEVELRLPPSDTLGPVDVHAVGAELATLADGFTYEARPSLEALLPNVGASVGGDEVALGGQGITTSCSVWFGTSNIPVERFPDGRYFVTTPGGSPGTVDVALDCGARGAELLEDAFTYDDSTTLGVIGFQPASAFASGGTVVTVSGTGLLDVETVHFGGVQGTIVEQTSYHLRVLTPAVEPGLAVVTVSTEDDDSDAPEPFRFVDTANFSGLFPRDGSVEGGWRASLTGAGLSVVDAVWIDGQRIEPLGVGGTEVNFDVPGGPPGDVDVLAEIAGMKVDTGFDISYLAPIRFDGFSPSAGPTGGGTLITVTGAGFGSDCQIVVDGIPLQTERIATSALVARTPPAAPGGVAVAVTGCDAEWTAPNPYMYNDSASPPGGVFGDEIDGQLVVSVIEAGSNARIEGATVMVGIRDDSPWVALTDERGQATFIDDALQGPQTITAYAPERSAESIVNVNANEVTLVLNPIPSPPCDPRDPDCVPPPPPPTGQIIGFLTGMVKLADPPPGAVVAAIIETTRYSSGYGNPNPGPGGVLFENGAFAITTRLGEMALVAQCGWFENYGTPEQRFVPQRIGVTRGIFIREGDPAYRTAVDCSIPLDQRVSFKLTGAPELVPEPNPADIVSGEAVTYPGFFGIDVVFSFGAEGVFETLPRIRSTEPLFTAGGFPSLSGPLADVVVSFGAGAYDHIYSAPYARSYVRRISRYDRVITFPAMLPVPEITVPSESSDAEFLGVVEWTYPDAAPVPDLYHFTVSGQLQDFPRYSIFVPGHQRGLDLADFPEFNEQIGQVPAPGEPGTVLGLYVRAIDLDVFDFNAFDRYVLRGTNWNAMSLGYTTVFFTPEAPAN